MNLINKIVPLLLIITASAEMYSQPALSLENNSFTFLKSNLEFLASDELEGRESTTRGEKIAALFISEELEKYGVLPYGDSGGYYQDFNIIVRNFEEISGVSFNFGDYEKSYSFGKDIIYSKSSFPHRDYNGIEYDAVFAGYGIVSEEDDYDSYGDINADDKVVVLLSGTPKKDNKEILSKSTVRKFTSSSSAKSDIAVGKGAAGLIILPSDLILNNWESISRWSKRKSYNLESEIESDVKNIPIVFLNKNPAQDLLNKESLDYESIIDSDNPYPESFSLKNKVRFDFEITEELKVSRNIIGLIKGNDPKFDSEFVTIGAHYDHEGIRKGKVYYGADDNGSGTVTILEAARRLQITKKNKRPVLIIFHAAEEKGLKGSKYLTQNSSFVDSIIVHINFDMVGRKSEDSIYCIGASKISSELGKLIEDVNARTSKFVLDYKFDEPNDSMRLYYRSDHYNYAKLGIPIAFFYDFMRIDYTKPTDTVDKINFDKLLRMTDLTYNLVIELSNLEKGLSIDKKNLN